MVVDLPGELEYLWEVVDDLVAMRLTVMLYKDEMDMRYLAGPNKELLDEERYLGAVKVSSENEFFAAVVESLGADRGTELV